MIEIILAIIVIGGAAALYGFLIDKRDQALDRRQRRKEALRKQKRQQKKEAQEAEQMRLRAAQQAEVEDDLHKADQKFTDKMTKKYGAKKWDCSCGEKAIVGPVCPSCQLEHSQRRCPRCASATPYGYAQCIDCGFLLPHSSPPRLYW